MHAKSPRSSQDYDSGLGATATTGARGVIEDLNARPDWAFSVNLFVHATARADKPREAAWLA